MSCRKLGAAAVGISATLTLAAAAAASTEAPRESHATPAIQQLLGRVLKATGAPGGVIVVTDGSRTWQGARGLANVKTHARMRTNHRFRIASVTKMFVATVVLQLVAEQRLSLGDTVERWLPGQVPGGAQITVRHLLSHTSGIGSESLQEPPGAFHYSDGNYMLLGSIITAVTGSTVKQELERRVFQPLSLKDTVWPTTPTVPRLARGYFGRADVTSMPPSILTPASGLVSTAPNVRTFLRALLRGRLLASSELEAMKTYGPRTLGESYDAYGLGLMYVSSPCPVWGHRGRFGGYTSFALADGSGRRIVVILVNSGGIGEVARAAVTRLVATTVCS